MLSLSRRKLLGGTIALTLLGRGGLAQAYTLQESMPALRELLGRHWSGQASTPTSATQSGELVIGLDYDFNLSDDASFTGTCRITSNWDSTTYRASYDISGNVWGSGSSFGLTIANTSLRSGDSLPSTLYWQGLTGSLNLYQNSDGSGKVFMQGTLTGTVGGDKFTTQLT